MGVKGRRWIKTRVKEAAEIKKAEIKAEATALRQVRKKQTPLELIREYIEKALAKVDPMEAIAVVGATILIKNGIDWTEEILINATNSPLPNILGIITYVDTGLPYPFEKRINFNFGSLSDEKKTAALKEASNVQTEIIEWIISFTLAYVLIHNAGAILEATGNILSSAKNLLGIVPKA